MLNKAKTLTDFRLDSLDGEMGRVKDFYFNDQDWTIRYVVADTNNWLPGRQVLISPPALVAAIKGERHIAVSLTKKQIETSPSLSSDKPVSRQHEHELHVHYGWSPYWAMGTDSEGGNPASDASLEVDHDQKVSSEKREWDTHLRSMQQVVGYRIQATDGEIGHVEDFVIDDEVWAIRYLIVDTGNWWSGKKVLVSPQWVGRVRWRDATILVDMSRERIRESPEFTKESLMNLQDEGESRGPDPRPGEGTDGPSETLTGEIETHRHSKIKHKP